MPAKYFFSTTIYHLLPAKDVPLEAYDLGDESSGCSADGLSAILPVVGLYST